MRENINYGYIKHGSSISKAKTAGSLLKKNCLKR